MKKERTAGGLAARLKEERVSIAVLAVFGSLTVGKGEKARKPLYGLIFLSNFKS